MEILNSKGISIREYAKLAGYPTSYSYVAKIIRGVNPFPIKELSDFTMPLGLGEDQRKRFRELALLTHAPLEIRERYEDMRLQLSKKKARSKRS